MALCYPVIVVPGITASSLRDEYSLPPEVIWSVLSKDFGRATLHPDDPRYEALEPVRVRPDQIFEVAYEELINELRYNLSPNQDQPVPVYPFAYDWRQPLAATEQVLADFVDEVIERTKLTRHYHDERGAKAFIKNPKVNLIGHSMGGLVIGGYLERMGAKAKVAKVATLATPFQGSFEAVVKLITGTANLGGESQGSREREAARVTPALYHLLPSRGINLAESDGRVTDFFKVEDWQPSLLGTVETFVKAKSLGPGTAKDKAATLFKAFLSTAQGQRRRVNGLKLGTAGLAAKDWLCVAGVGAETRIGLTVADRRGKPEFLISSKDRRDLWADKSQPFEQWRRTGDGTVPFEGAVPKFLDRANLVCVSPDDYGYWEVADKTLTRVAGFHGVLPNMNMLHRLLVRHFLGKPDARGNTWGRRAPGVTKADWRPPLKLKDNTFKGISKPSDA